MPGNINLTPVELANTIKNYTEQDLKKMDHALLYQTREYAAPEFQNELARAEHRAFAREATAENPLMAVPIALATLAYQPYKMLMGQSRSSAGLDQVAAGLGGVKEGLMQALKL